uniref:BTB domain-containing protein n=1 Tax=Meloidogyne enterolobii TaxID=390850 RepID=A0A6V7VUA1_MELEN|nr:unnamed protein product [Meloidogyne enterolobii]
MPLKTIRIKKYQAQLTGLEFQEKLGYSQGDSTYICSLLHSDGSLYLNCDVEVDCYNSSDSLKNIYNNMFEREIFTDCVIKIGEDFIKTHRCILASNSKVHISKYVRA